MRSWDAESALANTPKAVDPEAISQAAVQAEAPSMAVAGVENVPAVPSGEAETESGDQKSVGYNFEVDLEREMAMIENGEKPNPFPDLVDDLPDNQLGLQGTPLASVQSSQHAATSQDVKAALLRATTLDLQLASGGEGQTDTVPQVTPPPPAPLAHSPPGTANGTAPPSPAPTHTPVMLNLAGVLQCVLVPLTPDQAAAPCRGSIGWRDPGRGSIGWRDPHKASIHQSCSRRPGRGSIGWSRGSIGWSCGRGLGGWQD